MQRRGYSLCRGKNNKDCSFFLVAFLSCYVSTLNRWPCPSSFFSRLIHFKSSNRGREIFSDFYFHQEVMKKRKHLRRQKTRVETRKVEEIRSRQGCFSSGLISIILGRFEICSQLFFGGAVGRKHHKEAMGESFLKV